MLTSLAYIINRTTSVLLRCRVQATRWNVFIPAWSVVDFLLLLIMIKFTHLTEERNNKSLQTNILLSGGLRKKEKVDSMKRL